MLYDILRVLLEKILISVVRKKVEKDFSFSENPYDSKGAGRQSTRYCFRPVMAGAYESVLGHISTCWVEYVRFSEYLPSLSLCC